MVWSWGSPNFHGGSPIFWGSPNFLGGASPNFPLPGIWSLSGWYASYWNAFLFFLKFFGGHDTFLSVLEATGSCECKVYFLFFFKKILEDISPFCGAPDTPVLDFWCHLPWVSPLV